MSAPASVASGFAVTTISRSVVTAVGRSSAFATQPWHPNRLAIPIETASVLKCMKIPPIVLNKASATDLIKGYVGGAGFLIFVRF
jgi:hypothetical protein